MEAKQKDQDYRIRLLVCCGYTLFREGIMAILRHQPSVEIVGEAWYGVQAIHQVERLHPDIVLMDNSLPDISGFEATRRIKQIDKNIRILILTTQDTELVERCLKFGASGYVYKDGPASQLLHAIEVVQQGGKYLDPGSYREVI